MVSALLTPNGLPSKILNLVLEGELTIVYDNSIYAEYINVLNRSKFNFDKDLIDLVMDFIVKEGEYVTAKIQRIKFTDEDDKRFYEVYKNAGVDYLVTGNKKHFPNEKGIVTPGEFLSKYR